MLKPELLLIISILFLIIIFLINYYNQIINQSFINIFCYLILIINLFFYLQQLIIINDNYIYIKPFLFICSFQTNLLKISTLLISLLFLINNSKNTRLIFKNIEFFYIIIFFFLLTFVMIISTINLFVILLCLESQTFLTILFLCYIQYKQLTLQYIFNYFILSSILTILFILSIKTLYEHLHTINFIEIETFFFLKTKLLCEINNYCLLNNIPNLITNKTYYYNISIILSLLCIFLILIFKLAGFPFHFWIKYTYGGLTLPILGFLTTITKLPLFYLIYKLLLIFHITKTAPSLLIIFLISSFGSIIYGTILTYKQKTIKTFLICSSITHVGFLLLLFQFYTKLILIINLFGYLLNYIITLLIIWSILLYIYNITNKIDISFNELNLILKYLPSLKYSLSCCFLSLAGLPPFIGFFFKFNIFLILITLKLYFHVFILFLLSIIIIYYYLQILKILFFDEKLTFNQILPILKINLINYKQLKFLIFFNIILILSFISYEFIYYLSYLIILSF